jgi:hypothetical protein
LTITRERGRQEDIEEDDGLGAEEDLPQVVQGQVRPDSSHRLLLEHPRGRNPQGGFLHQRKRFILPGPVGEHFSRNHGPFQLFIAQDFPHLFRAGIRQNAEAPVHHRKARVGIPRGEQGYNPLQVSARARSEALRPPVFQEILQGPHRLFPLPDFLLQEIALLDFQEEHPHEGHRPGHQNREGEDDFRPDPRSKTKGHFYFLSATETTENTELQGNSFNTVNESAMSEIDYEASFDSSGFQVGKYLGNEYLLEPAYRFDFHNDFTIYQKIQPLPLYHLIFINDIDIFLPLERHTFF